MVKNTQTLSFDDVIFGTQFGDIHVGLDMLTRIFSQNWCWYCNKHLSSRNMYCVVCIYRFDILNNVLGHVTRF